MKKTWKIEWHDKAVKELRKLNKSVQKEILSYLKEKISDCESPKSFGKPLAYDKSGLWRYRVRDHRIVCKIYESKLLVLVLRVGHLKRIYH